jgi:polar amino acid transport system permease protein
MSESNLESKRKSQLEELRERAGTIPVIRRLWFLLSGLFVVVLFSFFLPNTMDPSGLQWLPIVVYVALVIGWAALIFSDEQKPEILKIIVAIVMVIDFIWLFYRFSGADWKTVSYFFFAFDRLTGPGWTMLWQGLWLTVKIAFFSMIFSTIIGLLLAVFRSFNNKILNIFIIAYIDLFRSMPIIVLMMLIYFALPYTGIRLSAPVSGILALSLNSAAYVSEIFRAGILSIKRGQIEAAHALGLNTVQTMRLVILPQAVKVVIPPLASNYVASAKDTAICSSISILELLKQAMTFQAVIANPTPLIAATGMYILLLVPLTRLAGMLEVKMKSNTRRATV